MSSSAVIGFFIGLWIGQLTALILFVLLSREDPPHDQQ